MDKKEAQEVLKNKKIEITSKEKKSIIKNFQKKIDTKFIIVAIEEINELVQVLVENLQNNKVDEVHTIEELADTLIVRDMLMTYYDIKVSELEKISKHKVKPFKNINDNKSIHSIYDEMFYLIESTHILSKIIRGKNVNKNKIIDIINSINIGCYHILNYYNIKSSNIMKIKNFKLKRIKERTKENNPLNV